MNADPIQNDNKQWFRICQFCGCKESKVIAGNIVDWVHPNRFMQVLCTEGFIPNFSN